MGFIELSRRFQKVSEDSLSNEQDYESYFKPYRGDIGEEWDELLTHRLVVILGEPGSGKTQEVLSQARRLQELGKNAFFIRLDELVDQDFTIALDPKDKDRFHYWKVSSEHAIFFLDSVDEAKLTGYESFETALKKLFDALKESGLNRASFVVSSRIAEWRTQVDSDVLFHILDGIGEEKVKQSKSTDKVSSQYEKVESEKPYVVKILPLTSEQVRLFSLQKGLENPQRFIDALDVHNAWSFAGRPVDVDHLIIYWKEFRRLGTLSELIEHDIKQKLKEESERVRHTIAVPSDKKREGLEFLAAAVTFCQMPHFSVEDKSSISHEGSALAAIECLPPMWEENSLKVLKDNAVFDVATYGRMRFHHKSVVEYLTASWLNKRMFDGCDFPSLENILFEAYDTSIVPKQGLEPIIGWLACGNEIWNQRIRTNLKEYPEIILNYGDPESLPADYKREVLESLLAKYKGRKRAFFNVDIAGLKRFSDASLAPTINQMLAEESMPDDIKADLLHMVSGKKILDCLDIVLKIATTNENEYLQAYAIETLGELKSKSHLVALSRYVDTSPNISPDVSAHLCMALYPSLYSAEQLVKLLHKTAAPEDKVIGISYYLRTLIEKEALNDDLQLILKGLLPFVENPPYKLKNNKEVPFSEEYFWLNEVISILIYLILTRICKDDIEYDLVARAMLTFSYAQELNPHRHHIPGDFKQVVDSHNMLKREFYHLRIKGIAKGKDKKETLPSAYEVFYYYSDIDLNLDDLDWLLEETQTSATCWHKRVAMNMAIDLWYTWGRKHSIRVKIRSQVRSDKLLYKEFKEKTKFRPLLRLKGYMRTIYHRGSWRTFKNKIKNKYSHKKNVIWLHRNIKRIGLGQEIQALNYLVQDSRCKEEANNHWSVESLKPLVDKYGVRIANAAKKGWLHVWENYSPQLPHEKGEDNRVDVQVIIGLSGIRLAILSGDLKVMTLSIRDVKRACRYALNELNGFPEWFNELVIYHPETVKDTLVECIKHEWLFEAEQKNIHQVLYKVSYNVDLLGSLVSDDIMNLLEHSIPKNLQILDVALKILLSEGDTYRERLVKVSKEQCEEQDITSTDYIVWLATWIQLNAESALEVLETKVNEPDFEGLIISLCANLKPDRLTKTQFIEDPDYLQAKHLRSLIPIVYQCVKLEDDLERAGRGAYHPGQRDHAQDFRNGLLEKLADINNQDAEMYLRELSELPELSARKEWILHLLDKRAVSFSVASKWKPKDIVSFSEEFAVEPKSDHELFKVLNTALRNIKDDVERGDISSRKDLHDKSNEADMRTWLARQLIQQAKDRYKVPQEEEIDLQQKPDLRIEKPGLNPVSIEMKVADNWTPKELIDAINNQLIGQYLRATNTNYGVFMLGYVGRKKYWINPETNEKMNFEGLVNFLDKNTPTQSTNYDGLKVIGIDYTVPK